VINSLRFADDIDLTAELSEDLQQITDRMYVGIDLTAELSEDLQQITDRMYVGSKFGLKTRDYIFVAESK